MRADCLCTRGILWRPLEMDFEKRPWLVYALFALHNLCMDRRVQLIDAGGVTRSTVTTFDMDGAAVTRIRLTDTKASDLASLDLEEIPTELLPKRNEEHFLAGDFIKYRVPVCSSRRGGQPGEVDVGRAPRAARQALQRLQDEIHVTLPQNALP